MEGPSLFLAAEQLAPFVHEHIQVVSGNSKIGIERLLDKEILEIFSWGKHLVFQFDQFAIRVHFLLFGSFEASVDGKAVTGDYPKKGVPRLSLSFENGTIRMYNCSLKYLETSNARTTYDFTTDVMSIQWDAHKAFLRLKEFRTSEIGDVLLDQTIFSGVGNIIKNEVLSQVKINPETIVDDISPLVLKKLVKVVSSFVWQFYEWRKNFILRKHFLIYRQSFCPHCGNKVTRKKTGQRRRISFYCQYCQPISSK